MGRIGAEEVLTSAVVAATVSGAVSLRVARSTATATVEAARVAVGGERARAVDEERRQCRVALVRAVEGWQIAAAEELEWSVRKEQAGRTRGGLIEVATILGPEVRNRDFEELLEALIARSEEDLMRAQTLWPPVQETIVSALSPRPPD